MIKYLFELSALRMSIIWGKVISDIYFWNRLAEIGVVCIIYCGKGIGYYQGEPGYGAPPRFMLLAEK